MTDLCPVNLSLVLAQNKPEATRADVIWLITVIILLFLILTAAILFLRQRSQRKQDDDTPKAIYSLHELRQLRRKGEITEEEFERLRDVVNTQTRKQGP